MDPTIVEWLGLRMIKGGHNTILILICKPGGGGQGCRVRLELPGVDGLPTCISMHDGEQGLHASNSSRQGLIQPVFTH